MGRFLASGAFRALAIIAFVVVVVALVVKGPKSLSGGEQVDVTMWTSGEKMTYLRDVTDQYNKAGHKIPGSDKKIHVDLVQVNSGPMSDYLIAKVRDGIEFPKDIAAPQIVSPSVDTWLTRVNYVTG